LDKALMRTAIPQPLSLPICTPGQHWDPNIQKCTPNLLPSAPPWTMYHCVGSVFISSTTWP